MEKLEHTVFQISELIGKERFGTLSEEENEVLEEWRRQSAEHETLYQKLQDTRYLSESVARCPVSIPGSLYCICRDKLPALPVAGKSFVCGRSVEWQLYSLFCWGASGWFTGSLRFGNLRSTAHSGRRASCCFTFGKRRTHPFGYLATNDYTRRGQDF